MYYLQEMYTATCFTASQVVIYISNRLLRLAIFLPLNSTLAKQVIQRTYNIHCLSFATCKWRSVVLLLKWPKMSLM